MRVETENGTADIAAGFLQRMELVVHGTPVAKARPRGRATIKWSGSKPYAVAMKPYTPKAVRNYEHSIASAVRHLLARVPADARRFKPSAPLCLQVMGVWPRPKGRPSDVPKGAWRTEQRLPRTAKPDYDNLGKVVADALNGTGVWLDDSHITRAIVETHTAAAGERAHVHIVVHPLTWQRTPDAPLLEIAQAVGLVGGSDV